MEVSLNVTALISWAREVIGESSRGREVDGTSSEIVPHDDFWIINCSVLADLRSSYR